MRVAAGVILIIAAVINLFAGLGYMAGGAFVGGAGKMGAAMEEASKKQGRELTEEEKKSFEQLGQVAGQAKSVVGVLMAYGLFLLVTAGTSIAGAVCLFRRRAVKFIIIASILAISAEVLSCVVVGAVAGAGVGLTKLMFSLMGIIGGTFGIIGARQIAAASAMPAAAPPAAMPM